MEIVEEVRSHKESKRYADGELQECIPGHSDGASWEKSHE
jgi:hypothetical protein